MLALIHHAMHGTQRPRFDTPRCAWHSATNAIATYNRSTTSVRSCFETKFQNVSRPATSRCFGGLSNRTIFLRKITRDDGSVLSLVCACPERSRILLTSIHALYRIVFCLISHRSLRIEKSSLSSSLASIYHTSTIGQHPCQS